MSQIKHVSSSSPEQLAIAEKLFQLRLLRSDGQAFEDIFVEVMTRADADFRPIKPQGNLGDKKNDGYSARRGIFHQVYAPEKLGASKALEKLEEDFAGLIAYWGTFSEVKEFYFVINDKFKGAYATIEKALMDLKGKHKLDRCEPFLNKDLVRIFCSLEIKDVIAIVGSLPSPDSLDDLDYSVFTDVLSHIMNSDYPIDANAVLVVPDFDKKIRWNRISDGVKALLVTGNMQSGVVEQYFSGTGTFSKTAVRDKLAALYMSEKENKEPRPDIEFSGDVIFFSLLEKLLPVSPTNSSRTAAIVLLSFFFETCDVYDDPDRLL